MGDIMRVLLLACVTLGAAIAACPVALAQPLKASEIPKHIEGVWGWPGKSPDGLDLSCDGDPMRIWFEDDGRSYRSQQVSGGKIMESQLGMPSGAAADYILISYRNHPQPGLFGRQVVWALRMPDRDHFFWQEFPLGSSYPRLERCGRPKVG
jgi:hypothetical protein